MTEITQGRYHPDADPNANLTSRLLDELTESPSLRRLNAYEGAQLRPLGLGTVQVRPVGEVSLAPDGGYNYRGYWSPVARANWVSVASPHKAVISLCEGNDACHLG